MSSATAVHRLVLSTAAAADMFDAYGSPPLNPFQPSHSSPAPTATINRLFGASISRSRCNLGPITAAATNPEIPAARWITYPAEASRTPWNAKKPPPQSRNALTVYTNVIHSSTNGIQALKLMRPSTDPSIRIGVIAANTNWK